MAELLKDVAAERTLLGTIIRNGKNALIDCMSIVDSTDFSLVLNQVIFTALKHLANNHMCQDFDAESIKFKMKSMGYNDYVNDPKILEYLEYLPTSATEISNVMIFALQIRKYSIARGIKDRYSDGIKYLNQINEDETVSNILQHTEGILTDYIAGISNSSEMTKVSDQIDAHVQELLDSEPVGQVGLPTGYPLWDLSIGGGLRRGTITVEAARPKKGKSYKALNVLLNVAKLGIPVLYLDSELTKKVQNNRILSILSGCPFKLLETSQFKTSKDYVDSIKASGQLLKDLPITYLSVAGMSHTEALMLARRWIIKEVGIRPDGRANDCVIVYDYMKLTSGNNLSHHTPEYILLGLMLTDMHNFAVKYDVPILGFVQLNRDGIDNDDTSIIAGSDRILWLCSSMSVLRDKNQVDIDGGASWDDGNKKLAVLETRFGCGLDEGDYINLKASLRPRYTEAEGTGLIIEGLKHSELVRNHA
jgi:replicative DNA helicase